MAAEASLDSLREDAARRVPDRPTLDDVVDAAGRARLAAYYLYGALIAGLTGEDGLTPDRWPPEVSEPIERMGLTHLAPRTERGLDAVLTPGEQATRRSAGRQYEFAQLTVDLINHGAFGPVCGEADRVRLADSGDRRGLDIELLAGDDVVGTCKAEDHWELVAQQLATAPHGDDPLAESADRHAFASKVAKRLRESGISHAISRTTDLAVGVSPLGTAVGVGTRLVRSRIQTGRQEADALHQLHQALHRLRVDAEGMVKARQADQ
jgi:hypothetical protein